MKQFEERDNTQGDRLRELSNHPSSNLSQFLSIRFRKTLFSLSRYLSELMASIYPNWWSQDTTLFHAAVRSLHDILFSNPPRSQVNITYFNKSPG